MADRVCDNPHGRAMATSEITAATQNASAQKSIGYAATTGQASAPPCAGLSSIKIEASNAEKIPRPKYRSATGASPGSTRGTSHHERANKQVMTADAITLVRATARATVVGKASGTRVMNITDPMAPGSNVKKFLVVHDSRYCPAVPRCSFQRLPRRGKRRN